VNALGAFALRLAGVVLFLPLAIPFMVVAPLTVVIAGMRWLLFGGDERATDRLLLNRAVCWADDLPLLLFEAAKRARSASRSTTAPRRRRP
jgi:hypothetical protein